MASGRTLYVEAEAEAALEVEAEAALQVEAAEAAAEA